MKNHYVKVRLYHFPTDELQEGVHVLAHADRADPFVCSTSKWAELRVVGIARYCRFEPQGFYISGVEKHIRYIAPPTFYFVNMSEIDRTAWNKSYPSLYPKSKFKRLLDWIRTKL